MLYSKGGDCILGEGVFWSTGGQHCLMGYYVLVNITNKRCIQQVSLSDDTGKGCFLQLRGSFNVLGS